MRDSLPSSRIGSLYIVATPIGNWEDITLRALRILREVPLIAAEDVRVTRRLLAHYAITTPLVTYAVRRAADPIAPLLEHLKNGSDIALVCDVGTPAIADPGAELISRAIAGNIPVYSVPGPNAALCALVLSGLPAGRFRFDGFPPRSRADRAAFFAALAPASHTLILYESASHLRATLRDLTNALGAKRKIVLARNLTSMDETIWRGTLMEAQEYCRVCVPRGQYTLVIAGQPSDFDRKRRSA